jgi:hypothetical protein
MSMPMPMPFNFMEELTRLRKQHDELQARRTQLLWSNFTTTAVAATATTTAVAAAPATTATAATTAATTAAAAAPPQLLQQLYDDVVVRLPEVRPLYSAETFFDMSLTPMENRVRLTKALSPLVPPERLFKSLNALWQVMSRIIGKPSEQQTDLLLLNDKILAVEQRMVSLDKQNILMSQLLQMYEHVINTSGSTVAMQKTIGAIQNDQVRENMLVLFESTKPLMELMFLV